uniref:Uncharacterized protein n=1 Tax=Biomphalaria glabrata TaxID=6526 RepID=A0A2C9JJ18_BIOGL
EFIPAFYSESVMSILQVNVLAIIINNAAIGIVTSLFLRSLNSILKTFASALELMFTAVLCWLIFGIPVDLYTVLAIFIVSAATYLYAQNPVVNKARTDIDVDTSKDHGKGNNFSQEGHSFKSLFEDLVKHRKVLILYFIPAALYCLYNNLQFVNLSAYDPTTYYLLLQFRVVVTGVIFQLIFKKQLSRIQWASLLILTLGCIIKEVRHDVSSAQAMSSTASSFVDYLDIHLLFIMFQVFSSCFAGVYNEFLLKDTGADVHIMMANVFMYLNSIICNVLILAFKDIH